MLALIPLYIIQYKIDNAAQHSYASPYSSFNYIHNDTLNADIVVFGNSRAQCHYFGNMLDTLLGVDCYNLGLSGYSFDYQYNLQILPYIKKNTIPRLLILEVGPQAFFRHWNDDFRKEFLPYLNNKYFKFYLDVCEEVSWKDRILPIKYYGWGINELFAIYHSTQAGSKYKDCFTPIKINNYTNNFLDTTYALEHNDIIIQYFTDCINICEEKDLSLLLVCSPMHKGDFYDKCRMNEFWQLIDSLAPNIPKLDYSLMFGSDTTYFAESTHLNMLGAEIFTTKLAHDIDSLGLLKK